MMNRVRAGRQRGRWAFLTLSVVALLAGTSGTSAPAADDLRPSRAVADNGATVLEETWLDARTVDLKISSPT
jgi:hypothetical protein